MPAGATNFKKKEAGTAFHKTNAAIQLAQDL
jgi:hypothetical protein